MMITGFLNSEQTKEKYLNLINTINKKENYNINFNVHFVNHPFLEITGNYPGYFDVKFYDGETLIHNARLSSNMWTRVNRRYYTKWRIEVTTENGDIVYNETLNLNDKRVYITIDSTSLGDNIAWMPYLEEFRKTHDCKLIVSTFKNNLFKKEYPNILFVEPGTVVHNLYAMYTIGWYYNPDMEPELPNTISLQKAATNILGLPFEEIKPRITIPETNVVYDIYGKPIKEKYITIAPHSTAGLKHWNNETGWQEVINFLKLQGFRIINLSKEGCHFNGVETINDYSLNNTIKLIKNCEFFIGLSSGLSWLSWALDKKVVMISNFTEKKHEFIENCIRITNDSVCNSCWNNPNFKFDKGDWNWCPIHKNTERQFECHKSITGNMVIDELKKII